MRPLSDLAGPNLEWREPKALQRRYELRSGSGHFATLEFESAWDTRATATTAAGAWHFQRSGILNPRVTVRAPGAVTDLAAFQTGFWGDGSLTLADGTVYTWRPINFWNTRWAFFDAGGRPLVTFHAGVPMQSFSDLFRNQSGVELDHQAFRLPHFDLLVTLGWYIYLLHQADGTAATTATIAAIG